MKRLRVMRLVPSSWRAPSPDDERLKRETAQRARNAFLAAMLLEYESEAYVGMSSAGGGAS